MGGGNSSPEYMEEIRIYSNDTAKEKFENKTTNIKYFLILLLILFCLLIFYFYKNRYKD